MTINNKSLSHFRMWPNSSNRQREFAPHFPCDFSMNEISHTPRFLGPIENSNEFPTGSKNFRNTFILRVLIELSN